MHTHAYIWRVRHPELYSGIQGRRKRLWTLMDPDMYMRHMDIFPLLFLIFSFLISSQKTLSSPTSSTITWQTLPIITASCITPPPYILLFSQHSPVVYKDNFPLFYMYKSSRYYFVFDIDLGPMFPRSTTLYVLKLAPLEPSSTLAYIASDFLVLPLSPIIIICIQIIFAHHSHLLLKGYSH